MTDPIPYISIDMIENGFKPGIGYYWSDNFSKELYIKLSQMGLICVSNNFCYIGDILLPEMQEAYAVLHFNNLHISKKVKRLLKLEYKLIINQDLDSFLPLLKLHHGSESWFTKSYIHLMYNLKDLTLYRDNFQLNTVIMSFYKCGIYHP
ncbi:hypothetical protein EW093_15120 [Thiospirochaeta perfilievii]|uniref:Uncharacterized protein n=1 Tax=Thiospirochaeta perfilievii TaxID=252967 RepID=A0A5C1QFQ3_9SPIO|nr:hypothetical protein [Thiospirochaeta perfilievii]QEN05970.1 hypothetical protein EW093_15120 [Thiospirochaeta perfilievii]